MRMNKRKIWLGLTLLWFPWASAIADLDYSDSDQFPYDARWVNPSFGESDEFPFDARWVNPSFGESSDFDADFTRLGRACGDSGEFCVPPLTVEQEFFDDFAYTGWDDPRLNGWWQVRSWDGGPGHDDAHWRPWLVQFVEDDDRPGNVLLQMHAKTSGTPETCEQSEVGTSERFFEGTYCARIRFTDAPRYTGERQPSVQAFFAMSPWVECDESFSECDFEYLPNDSWNQCGDVTPSLLIVTWEEAGDPQSSPECIDNVSSASCATLWSWKTCWFRVADNEVSYYVDDVPVDLPHDDDHYPDSMMRIAFSHWFTDGLIDIRPDVAAYAMEVDWVYHAKNVALTGAEVEAIVARCRANDIDRKDTMRASNMGGGNQADPADIRPVPPP